jgi:hypothetical protein
MPTPQAFIVLVVEPFRPYRLPQCSEVADFLCRQEPRTEIHRVHRHVVRIYHRVGDVDGASVTVTKDQHTEVWFWPWWFQFVAHAASSGSGKSRSICSPQKQQITQAGPG